MVEEPEYRPSITKVWAKNFRSIEFAELELEPLTVLVGPNASGKSNLMDILGFLGDATRLGLETAITRRGGIDSIGRKLPTGRVLGPEIGYQYESLRGTLNYTVALTRRGKGEYWVKRESARLHSTDSGDCPLEFALTNGRLTKPNLKRILKQLDSTRNEGVPAVNFARIADQLITESDRQDIQLMSAEPVQLTLMLALSLNELGAEGKDNNLSLHQSLSDARDHLGRIGLYHIFPNSLRDPQKVADSHPLATGGENLASTLRDMIQKKSRFLPDLKSALTFAVPGVRNIRVSHAGSYYVVELNHERDGGNEQGSWFDLSHESDGTIRLLALLTALFQDPAPSLIGLEEPELAIHPGAMVVLSDNMKEAALRGQVLVATHSPDLINRLPIESIRAVTAEDGSTMVGKVTEHQLTSVKENLFSAGELHSMEGLQPASITTTVQGGLGRDARRVARRLA